MVPRPPAPRILGLGQNLQEEGWLPAASNLGQDKSWDQILSARWMIMFPLCSPLGPRVNHGMWVALESDREWAHILP